MIALRLEFPQRRFEGCRGSYVDVDVSMIQIFYILPLTLACWGDVSLYTRYTQISARFTHDHVMMSKVAACASTSKAPTNIQLASGFIR
jgi:hypothetical protein